ncbi:hypothetical protein [Cryobacterium roopkundense]|nr:hypothetical protein [Cryobacterium roopkundense]MBB5640633.1 hypothetical protein [Cryobacterium roopkundense]
MTAISSPEQETPSVRFRRVSAGWSLAAAGLFVGSAVLQLLASLQRWVGLSGSGTLSDVSIEDHRFDYFYPADPWENVGTAAQLFGAGLLLLALGILVMTRAAAPRDGHLERMLALLVASSFGIHGAHALVSGAIGAPTPLQYLPVQMLLSLIGFVGLVAVGARLLRVSRAASVACVLLVAVTLPGYIVATFQIAPVIAGYQSYDTTPWTETILAASTAAAGVALAIAAGRAGSSHRRAARGSASGPPQ